VSLDVQGYLRHVENNKVSCKVSDHLAEALLCSTLVKAASEELEVILGCYGMSIEDLIRTYDLREAIVTAGRRGGYVVTASNVVSYQAKAVEHKVDPTGAGDVFFASYLASRLHARQSIEEACERAASLAARQVEGRYIPGALLRAPEPR
jgi:sugar/nucleoside kinase (ribokinase family)